MKEKTAKLVVGWGAKEPEKSSDLVGNNSRIFSSICEQLVPGGVEGDARTKYVGDVLQHLGASFRELAYSSLIRRPVAA